MAVDAAKDAEPAPPPVKTFNSNRPLKSGAKRKLNVRDDDSCAVKESESEDANYNSKKPATTSSANHKVITSTSITSKDDHAVQQRMLANKVDAGAVRIAEAATRRYALGSSK